MKNVIKLFVGAYYRPHINDDYNSIIQFYSSLHGNVIKHVENAKILAS